MFLSFCQSDTTEDCSACLLAFVTAYEIVQETSRSKYINIPHAFERSVQMSIIGHRLHVVHKEEKGTAVHSTRQCLESQGGCSYPRKITLQRVPHILFPLYSCGGLQNTHPFPFL